MVPNDIYVWDVVTTPKMDSITKQRKLIYLSNLGIPHACEFGRCDYQQSTNRFGISPHMHTDSFEICYHISGKQIYYVGNNSYETTGGEVFITFPNEVHSSGEFPESKSRFYYFAFNCTKDTKNFIGLNDSESDYLVYALLGIRNRHFKGNPIIKQILDRIMALYCSDEPLKKVRIQHQLVEFFLQIINSEKNSYQNVVPIPQDIQNTIEYIHEHIFMHLSLQELAERIYLSVPRFKQKFKQYVGTAPMDYILRKKIEIAQELIIKSGALITDISFKLDFSSSQYFSKVFKRYTSMSPLEYKTRYSGGSLFVS